MVPSAESHYSKLSCTSVNHNSTVDVLKGICIIFVVLTHCEWEAAERLRFFFPYWVEMAVPVFMIISGYVYKISLDRIAIKHLEDAYAFSLLLRKIIRYGIPYVIAISIELAWYVFKRDITEISDIIKVILVGGIGPGSYYFPIIIQFIFIFPIIYFIIKTKHFKGLLICLLINIIYEVMHWAYGMNGEFYRLMIFRYVFMISLGCYAGFEPPSRNKLFYVCIFILGAIFIYFNSYVGYSPIFLQDWTSTSFLAGMYIAPIIVVFIHKIHLQCKPLELVGRASFNVFLTQMIYYCILADNVMSKIDSRAFQMLINIAICLMIGVLFYLIEEPLTKKAINVIFKKPNVKH